MTFGTNPPHRLPRRDVRRHLVNTVHREVAAVKFIETRMRLLTFLVSAWRAPPRLGSAVELSP